MTSNGRLLDIFEGHTGKVSDKWESYLHRYEKLFAQMRVKPIRLLEIGVQNGGSLEIWGEYFTQAQALVGVDIDPLVRNLTFGDPRIRVTVGDASQVDLKSKFHAAELPFDIIIDDGSHRSGDVIKAFLHLIPLLADGGVYIIEDAHTSYFAEYDGSLFDAGSMMTFFQRLTDVINQQHWDGAISAQKAVSSLLERRGVTTFDVGWMSRLHSITFANSMIIIETAASATNEIGNRRVTGLDEGVVSGRLEHSGTAYDRESLSSRLDPRYPVQTPEETLDALRRQLADCERSHHDCHSMIASLSKSVDELAEKKQLYDQHAQILSTLREELNAVHHSTSWLLTRPYRWVGAGMKSVASKMQRLSRVTRRMIPLISRAARNPSWAVQRGKEVVQIFRTTGVQGVVERISGRRGMAQEPYREWVGKYATLSETDKGAILKHIERMATQPLFSVVMPVYNPSPQHLDAAIQSVRDQLYRHWELCIADDASTDIKVHDVIRRHAEADPRIKAVFRNQNGHICAATNSAIDLSSGEFIALMDHDDIITEHALYWVASELNDHPSADVIYSDSDLIDDHGVRHSPHFKTDFDAELMLGHNLVSHLGVYRSSLVKQLGGMRLGLEGSQDYDLFLRVLSLSSRGKICHIPSVLYHWRRSVDAPSYSAKHLERCVKAAMRAVDDHLGRSGVKAAVVPAPLAPIWQRIIYELPVPSPTVSIIVPTRDRAELLQRCALGLLKATDYESLELIIVDNDSIEASTRFLLDELQQDQRVRVLQYHGPFNFAAINNMAAKNANGDVLIFLNNDIEIVDPGWCRELASRAVNEPIGAVGAKLLYPDGRIQHIGVTTGLGPDRLAAHIHCLCPQYWAGIIGETFLAREVSAVTAACMAIRRTVFLESGGFDQESFAVAYNDVDLCLRLRDLGYINVVTPFAELVHHESATRGSDLTPENLRRFDRERASLKARWGEKLINDPYYNPNFSLDGAVPVLAQPPRIIHPWHKGSQNEGQHSESRR